MMGKYSKCKIKSKCEDLLLAGAKANEVMLRIMMLLRNGVCLTANDAMLSNIADCLIDVVDNDGH